jgi:hypothetical protein
MLKKILSQEIEGIITRSKSKLQRKRHSSTDLEPKRKKRSHLISAIKNTKRYGNGYDIAMLANIYFLDLNIQMPLSGRRKKVKYINVKAENVFPSMLTKIHLIYTGTHYKVKDPITDRLVNPFDDDGDCLYACIQYCLQRLDPEFSDSIIEMRNIVGCRLEESDTSSFFLSDDSDLDY